MISEREHNIHFSTAVKYKQFYWSCSDDGKGIYKVDAETGKVFFVAKLGNKQDWCGYHQIILNQQSLYLIPNLSDSIVEYDLETNELKRYALDQTCCKGVGAKFLMAEVYKDFIYMFPNCVNRICRFNLVTKKIEYLQDVTELQVKLNFGVCNEYYFATGVVRNDKAWIPLIGRDMIISYNLNEDNFKIYELNSGEKGFRYLTEYEGDFYILARNGNVVKWNEKKGVCKKYKICLNNYNTDYGIGFAKIECYENNIWILPAQAEEIVVINKITAECRTIQPEIYQKDLSRRQDLDTGFFGEGYREHEYLTLYPRSLNGFININLITQEIETVKLNYNIVDDLLDQIGKDGFRCKINKDNVGRKIEMELKRI